MNTPLLNGFIKIERQSAAGVWTDVTLEILNLGFADRQPRVALVRDDPTPNAVIRLQRLRDNGLPAGTCVTGGADVRDYRRQRPRPTSSGPTALRRARGEQSADGRRHHQPEWRRHECGRHHRIRRTRRQQPPPLVRRPDWRAPAPRRWNNNGYIVYFSDRRGDHDETQVGDTGNRRVRQRGLAQPVVGGIAPANGRSRCARHAARTSTRTTTQQTYGETPWVTGGAGSARCDNFGFDADQRPWSTIPIELLGPRRGWRGRCYSAVR